MKTKRKPKPKKAPARKYCLEVSFPVKDMSEWERGNTQVTKCLGHSDGAGTGFGYRDMSWYDLTKQKAERMRARVLKVGVRGIKTRIINVDD